MQNSNLDITVDRPIKSFRSGIGGIETFLNLVEKRLDGKLNIIDHTHLKMLLKTKDYNIQIIYDIY